MPRLGNGRGWAAVVGLSVLTMALSVVQPALLIFLPLAVLLLALPPRPPLALALGALIVVLAFSGRPDGALWYFERGWALVVSAWFVVAVLAWPDTGFLPRALAAVFATAASASLLVVTNPGAVGRIDELMTQRLGTAIDQVALAWASRLGSGSLGRQFVETVDRAVELQAMLFPALLALSSLAALALAWWLFQRLSAKEITPLAPLREFRFHDGLIWLLVAGIVLLVLPVGGLASRAGSNLLAFMAALYALRGLAVLLVIGGGAPGPVGIVVAGVLLVVLYPLVVATTFLIGLTDTWMDIRTRHAAPPDPSS